MSKKEKKEKKEQFLSENATLKVLERYTCPSNPLDLEKFSLRFFCVFLFMFFVCLFHYFDWLANPSIFEGRIVFQT